MKSIVKEASDCRNIMHELKSFRVRFRLSKASVGVEVDARETRHCGPMLCKIKSAFRID